MRFEKRSRILIQCGDLVENKRRILPLAESLRLLGHNPVILHYSASAFSFFSSRGFECLDLGRFRSRVKAKDINWRNLAPEFFDEKHFRIFQIKRELMRTSKADSDRDLYMLRRDGLALTRLIDEHSIDGIVVWNGVTGHVANALRVLGAHQSKIAGYLERGYFSNSVFFDHYGTNGASSISKGIGTVYSRSMIEESVAAVGSFVGERVMSISPARDPGNKLIFVPLQVQLDSNILLYSNTIKTMRRLVLSAIDLARQLGNGWKVVVRDHPEEDQERLNIPYNDCVIRDNNTPLDELISASSVVFTVNSTVGMTAAFRGKVVICNGAGIYCQEPFVINAEGLKMPELADNVKAALLRRANEAQVKEYASVLIHRHLIDVGESGGIPSWGQTLKSFGREINGDQNPSLLDNIRDQLRASQESIGSVLGVEVRLAFGETIPLTYRRAERVTKRWIAEALTSNFPGVKFGPINEDAAISKGAAVCVVASNAPLAADLDGFLAILDEHGFPHYSYYEKRSCAA